MSLLSAHNLTKAFGPKDILAGVSVTLEAGDRLGLVGKNGAGKSTLVRILAGEIEPDGGEIIRRRDLSIETVEQAPVFDDDLTVGDVVLLGMKRQVDLRAKLEALGETIERGDGDLEALIAEQAELSERLERAGGWNVEHRGDAMLDVLSAPPKTQRIGTLSIGEKRRVALAVGLLSAPDILILDEPTNHLDVATIEWLEKYLVELPSALILVTHDRYFLDRVANRLAEIDRGELHLYEGNYTEYMVKKAERMELEARTERNKQRAIVRELDWVRASAPARTTKQKARLDRFDALVASQKQGPEKDVMLRLPHPPRIGKTILEIADLTLEAGDKTLVSGLDLILKKGDRIGIVGPNGAGKTTLIRTILGELTPAGGSVVAGKNTSMVYADQGRTDLDLDKSVIENVAGKNDKVFIGDTAVSVHGFLDQLLFTDGQQRALVGALSGGEKSRVALAKSLRVPGNLLILDEPTNDLDLATLRVLEDALEAYPGCALIVSHDRYFLDRVATAILAFEGNGKVVLYEGNHSMYRKRARPTEKAPPKEKKTRVKVKEERKRRTFNEQKEFDGIEDTIHAAEEKGRRDREAHQRPGRRSSASAPAIDAELKTLQATKDEIESLYERWEALSELEPYGG